MCLRPYTTSLRSCDRLIPIVAGSWAITSAYAGGAVAQKRGMVRKCHLRLVPKDICDQLPRKPGEKKMW